MKVKINLILEKKKINESQNDIYTKIMPTLLTVDVSCTLFFICLTDYEVHPSFICLTDYEVHPS